MVGRPKRARGTTKECDIDVEENTGLSGYEQFRVKRIKENQERLQKLGILDLCRKLKTDVVSQKRPAKKPSDKKLENPHPISGSPPRRSSRLKTLTPVSYVENLPKRKRDLGSTDDVEIYIKEGEKPEVYTEEDEKLLGDCKEIWTLCVDGYGENGKRIYDPENGETCHQCRQKTLGQRTHCSKCNIVQGQFCGDCLYMRYGENVIEVNENPSWVCPVCRGICNCSLCRKAKGWMPTGQIYKKVKKLGYKSVAHYLIQTRSETNLANRGAAHPSERSVSLADPVLHDSLHDTEKGDEGFFTSTPEESMHDDVEKEMENTEDTGVEHVDLDDSTLGGKQKDEQA